MISNTGQGMPILKKEGMYNGKYSVEAACSQQMTGSNLKSTDPDKVTGGINGVGIKVVNANSTIMIIETVDYKRKKYYKQTFKDGFNIIEDPIVKDLEGSGLSAAQKVPHTTVKFIPDYANVCRKTISKQNPDWKTPEHLAEFEKLLEFRTYQGAAFIASIPYRHVGNVKLTYPPSKRASVYFNGKLVPIHSMGDFARMFGMINPIVKTLSGRFPWAVSVGLNPNITKDTQGDLKGYHISAINGVNVPFGTHVNFLESLILGSIKNHIARAHKDQDLRIVNSMLKNLLCIVSCKHIPLADFNSQKKDTMTIGRKELNIMKKEFTIPPTMAKELWGLVKDHLELLLLTKKKPRKKKVHIRKYEPAEQAGKKDSNKCFLFIPEGDSAAKPIKDIINSPSTPLSPKYYGYYNIQGVPPNAMKETKIINIGGRRGIKLSKMLENNIAFGGLMAAWGLEFGTKYKTAAALATLNYYAIIIAVDQDLDGIGNIASLIMVFIAVFWPELYEHGRVRRLNTPVIRVYHGKDVINFYSDDEFKDWALEKFGGVDRIPQSYQVNYYKGLATHTEEEVIHDIGANIYENIVTYTWDDMAQEVMEIFYGTDTKPRKLELVTPVIGEYNMELLKKQIINCSEHWKNESKRYQQDFMRRKLKSAIDGFIPSQRKAFAGGRKMFANGNKKAKVYQVTGDIATKMHYQHGDTSMNGTITKMAQNFTGGRNMPIFIPVSNGFGDRTTGREKTGSARYINTKLNNKLTDLMFPKEDDWLLDYVYEDGMQSEPTFYIPIVPYSILENETTPGVGWAITVWARDFKKVLWNLRTMIKWEYPRGGHPLSLIKEPWLPEGMEVDICSPSINGGGEASEVCFGTYEYDGTKNQIIISQLPMRIWSDVWKHKTLGINPKNGKTENNTGKPLPKKELVSEVLDRTGNDKNNIIVKLKSGAYETIMENYGTDGIDPIEAYLGLYKSFKYNINMINHQNMVREFDNYVDVMKYWFPLRRALYVKRIERNILLLELRIMYWNNILLFINMDAVDEINIDKKALVVRIGILKRAKFVEFNKTNLLSPKYLKASELKNHILKLDASYKYIDDITIGQKSGPAVKRLEEKIKALEDELDKLRNTTWKKLWLEELDKFEAIVKEGIRTKWLFGIRQHIFKNMKHK
jgi:DNA topoisomerase-2